MESDSLLIIPTVYFMLGLKKKESSLSMCPNTASPKMDSPNVVS